MTPAVRFLPVFVCAVAFVASARSADPPALYRDTTAYPPLKLTWNASTEQRQVRGVFPHPVITQRAVVATATGLALTDDAGRTWTVLPAAATAKVGPILDVAFHPVLADTFYVASKTKGIWATSDAGKTFTQIGVKSNGLAADSVAGLLVYSGDSSHQTLLAVHGDAAPGISWSRDAGRTWRVVNTDYRFRRLLCGDGNLQQLYLFGSSLKEPDIQSVYSCSSVGEFVTDAVRDVVPTDMVFAPTPYKKAAAIYLTTADGGVSRIDNADSMGLAFNVKPLPFNGVAGWASVGAAWGASADALNLFLYDPLKLGMVVSSDDLATSHPASDGLAANPLVKEGAMLRPNSNGTVFYVVANGTLSIGRTAADVPVVTFTPAAFEVTPDDRQPWENLGKAFQDFSNAKGRTLDAAKALISQVGDPEALYHQHQMAVTARVPVRPVPPRSVTIDLSRYGGNPDTPLFDDGQHGDGAAGDGVYGATFAFLPERHQKQDNEWRTAWPGRVAMGVTASYADGRRRGAVGVADVFLQVVDVGIWHDGVGSVATTLEGGVTAEPFLNPLAPNQPSYAARLHKGDVAVRLKTPKGPWVVHFQAAYNKHDIDGRAALSFYARLEAGEAPKELSLQVRDEPEFSPPSTTVRVPVLRGLTLNGEYQRVVLPMGQVLGATAQFQSNHLSEIILSGDGAAPATLVLDGLTATAAYPPPPPPPEPAQ